LARPLEQALAPGGAARFRPGVGRLFGGLGFSAADFFRKLNMGNVGSQAVLTGGRQAVKMPSDSMQNSALILAESPVPHAPYDTCLPVLLAPGLFTAALANPYETTLKNGLRIIVKEDRRAPTAVQMVWYRIGSMDEVDGASGVAHVLEHMMFKGTPSVGPASSTSASPPPAGATTPSPAATTPPISSRCRRRSWKR
jgi:hypothetical protein